MRQRFTLLEGAVDEGQPRGATRSRKPFHVVVTDRRFGPLTAFGRSSPQEGGAFARRSSNSAQSTRDHPSRRPPQSVRMLPPTGEHSN